MDIGDRPWVVVIGVGNEYRRDDGVGLAVASAVQARVPPGVRVVCTDGEPSRLLDAWSGVRLAIVVDAAHGARGDAVEPGTVRITTGPGARGGTASSHALGVADAVEAADLGSGPGLSAPVAAATPSAVAAVLGYIETSTHLGT
jgi:hydrogenase maturation protease